MALRTYGLEHPDRDLLKVDILPSPKGRRDSSHRGEGFLLRRVVPDWAFARPGLTDSPQAVTASPAARMFFAALMSRSWTVLHSGQVQERTSKVKESSLCPQSKQRLEEG